MINYINSFRIIYFAALCLATFALAPAATAATSGAVRAWVSGHGVDEAGCGAVIVPCRQIAYVLSNALIIPGGEIAILDAAGFSPITITFAVSIINDGATASIIQPTAGQAAVTISAGATDVINLRGLSFEGLGTGGTGVLLNSGGSLAIVNCVARHFASNGIAIFPNAATATNFLVANTIVSDNGTVGLYVAPQSTGPMYGAIDHVTATNNFYGIDIYANKNGSSGHVTVSSSIASLNSDTGLYLYNANFSTFAISLRDTMSLNNYGLDLNCNNGVIYTYTDNSVSGINECHTVTTVPKF